VAGGTAGADPVAGAFEAPVELPASGAFEAPVELPASGAFGVPVELPAACAGVAAAAAPWVRGVLAPGMVWVAETGTGSP
jgi:hypothetical protein